LPKKQTAQTNYFNNIDDRDLIIETGTSGFTNDVLSDTSLTSSDQYADVKVSKGVRLTENDFILATNFTFTKQPKQIYWIILSICLKQKSNLQALLSLISNTTRQ
jgi:hypothetical protein